MFCKRLLAALAPGLAVAALSVPVCLHAQANEPPVALSRLSGPIHVDGQLIETAWQQLTPVPLVAFEPDANLPPSEPTEIRVGYDDRSLYVGAWCYDRDAAGIRINSLTRDRWAFDDLLEVVLDTFNDNETAVIFGTNPAGARFDSRVSNDADASEGFPIDESWNGFWDVKTTVTERGWFAEMRIPFSTLRFQSRDGRVVMGLIVSRYIARKNETVTYPAIDPKWDLGFNKPSVAQDVMLADVESDKPIYVTPYVLAGLAQTADPSLSHATSTQATREIGADVKVGVTENLALDLTVNTDFAQVEADDQQVNLTRYSIYFPEKRLFFQERAGIWDFRLGSNNRLFHSRRIGIQNGQLVPILGGARLAGRAGAWDIGLLDIQTTAGESGRSENFGVARVRHRLLNEFSYLGGMLTSRVSGSGAANVAAGADGSLRLGGDTYVTAALAQSFDDGAHGLSAGAGRLAIERRGREGFSLRGAFGYLGKDFEPGSGFTDRVGIWTAEVSATRGWLPGPGSPIRYHGPRASASAAWATGGGSLESAQASVGWRVDLKSGASLETLVQRTEEHLLDSLSFAPDVTVPPGSYGFVSTQLTADLPPPWPLGARFSAGFGQFYDGWMWHATLSPRWRLPPHVELNTDVEFTRVHFSARNQQLTDVIVRTRLVAAITRAWSGQAYLQYNTLTSTAVGNVRVRFSPTEGHDLYVAFNTTIDRSDVPTLVLDRTLVLKYSHALTL